MGPNVSAADKIPFGNMVDPDGVLAGCLSASVSHCIDNDVAYLALVDKTYVDYNPAGFRVGDIVEMGFAFVAWPVSANAREMAGASKYTCRLALRTLALLDATLTKARRQFLIVMTRFTYIQDQYFARADAMKAAEVAARENERPPQRFGKRRFDMMLDAVREARVSEVKEKMQKMDIEDKEVEDNVDGAEPAT
ncbi:hypothetical protein B0H12DRAFT_1246592 [Mycena haematopus]|nr:hypothetical protein B0H12DRAFT_1246592 [Mycena haematopus]